MVIKTGLILRRIFFIGFYVLPEEGGGGASVVISVSEEGGR